MVAARVLAAWGRESVVAWRQGLAGAGHVRETLAGAVVGLELGWGRQGAGSAAQSAVPDSESSLAAAGAHGE